MGFIELLPGLFGIFLTIDWLMARLSFESPPGIGFEILLNIHWLMARLSFEGPPAMGFEVF